MFILLPKRDYPKMVKISTILAGTLAMGIAGSISSAHAGSLELMPAQRATTLDLKVGGNLPLDTHFFVRSKTTVDYSNQVSPFLSIDLSYKVVGNVDAVQETQATPATGVIPRAGIQYAQDIGPFSLYGLLTESVQSNPNTELTVMANWSTPITEKVAFYTGVEEVTNVGPSHNFSLQRIRSGFKIGNYTLGAADVTETVEASYNIGGFGRINF